MCIMFGRSSVVFCNTSSMLKGKCEFHHDTISFLEYLINPDSVTIDQAKVTAVTEYPTPKTVNDLQWFLGFANFLLMLH